MQDKEKWSGLCSIGMSISTICKEGKEPTTEKSYYISSLSVDLPFFSKAVRGHWSVESMNWHLDVTSREDHNTTLYKNAVMNLNILREFCLGILKLLKVEKESLSKRSFSQFPVIRSDSWKKSLDFNEKIEEKLFPHIRFFMMNMGDVFEKIFHAFILL